ncbi:MAG: dihydrolipoyl dehydrogenase family protein [Tranquillimonas sp.]
MSDAIKTDICVIGAGAGGLSVAAGAVQMGARVVLVEGGRMGGDCLNHGCVPSKALIAAAHRAQALRDAARYGIGAVEPQVDYAAVMEHVQRAIRTIAPMDSQERFEGLGVRVIRDWARFVSPHEVEAGGFRIAARRFVIATGSRPAIPPVDGLDDVPYLTNETLFDLRERPGHLIVLGGGPIGAEMAQAHRRLGSRVTVIEAARALGREDPELAAVVLARLRDEGVELCEGRAVRRVAGQAGAVTVELNDGERLSGTHLLVAAGRRVALDRLAPQAGNIACDGGVTVGPGLRSVSNRRVYAVGDAAGGAQFTHLAGYHAGVVLRAILFGLPARARADHIPRATYTDPELAQVGQTEGEARLSHGDGIQVLRLPFAENDRAVAEGETRGLVKLILLKGRPVGVSIVGAGAGDLIAPWAVALANGHGLKTLTDAVLPYPTRSESARRVAGAYFSPKLFANPWVKRAVGLVQKALP